jgi:hypothetical protein
MEQLFTQKWIVAKACMSTGWSYLAPGGLWLEGAARAREFDTEVEAQLAVLDLPPAHRMHSKFKFEQVLIKNDHL